MVWKCEPILSKEKYVVMDSGFCVVNGIVALVAKELYSSPLIKNRRYWNKSLPGDPI